jgi:hypothetical protein
MSILPKNAKLWLLSFFVVACCVPLLTASNDLQKTQKKEFESAAKALNAEAKSLEKSGKLVGARLK